VVEQTKFLGLIFNKKLSFVPHLQYLRHKCLKSLNLLRVVANAKWGSDEKTLYCSLIRSKLEYGTLVYGSVRKYYLRTLEPIQNQALRTCLCAFRTSPVTSLHVKANEMHLDLRHRMLSSEYCLRVSSNIHNPVSNPNHIRPLGLCVSGDLSDIGFTQKNNLDTYVPSTPP